SVVREPRWKLITYDVKGLKTSQLFDLENDPLEMNNLVSNSDCQGHVERLEKLLAQALRDANDPKSLK
ncbi:MAG: DUF4976 domain-containing protein, partial [Planctomycetota bacterium]|nr:DUF4976 domain-containing protein [Planctomycetota bacterium]